MCDYIKMKKIWDYFPKWIKMIPFVMNDKKSIERNIVSIDEE